ncbi:MAG: hypothetical protein QM723_29715 [Myxococcaceae bacterium]
MRRIVYLLALGLVWAVLGGCPPSLPPPNDGGMTTGGGAGGGSSQFFTYVDLDTHAVNTQYIAVATDLSQDRIGVAYYVDTKVTVPSAVQIDAGLHDGTDNWEVHYLEWKAGQISGQSTLRVVQRPVGISVAFQPNGEPVVAYLGGDGQDLTGMSRYWFQSDPEISVRSGGSTWTQYVSNAKMSSDLQGGDTQSLDQIGMCASGPDGVGFVLGLWPAIAYDSTGKLYWAFRDVHSGQFPQQDWGASDLKVVSGTGLPPSSPEWCVKAGGDDKGSWGGQNQMAIGAGDLPAIAFTTEPLGPDNDGNSIFFTRLQSNGNWTDIQQITTSPDVQTGPGFAYDSTEGYGIAWVDHSAQSQLFYTHSATGDHNTWQTPTPIFGSGTGGWFPSLAMDPMHHEPAVSFYICSDASGKSEGSCTQDDELDIIQRISGNWRQITVDTFGSVAALDNPNRVISKVGFFSTGKRFVVYRLPQGDTLRLAVEK